MTFSINDRLESYSDMVQCGQSLYKIYDHISFLLRYVFGDEMVL